MTAGPVGDPGPVLARRLGTTDAVVVGLGSMIGAGVFAAFAPAAAAAGTGLLVGLAVTAVVAYCNATASAQLAAAYPTSGGTYVYGREQLGPWWGLLGRLGLRRRQDRELRGDGTDLRRVRHAPWSCPRPGARRHVALSFRSPAAPSMSSRTRSACPTCRARRRRRLSHRDRN